MTDHDSAQGHPKQIHQWPMTVTLFGPLRPSTDLDQQTQRVIKAHSDSRDHFTEITLKSNRNAGGMVVEYQVKAASPQSARRVGLIYLSQLCDLLSAVTQCPVMFCVNEDELREERIRQNRQGVHVNRTLTLEEWSWVTGSLVAVRREHPRFLAAASWFRKGLIGNDCLDIFCCYWRSIERIAEHYKDKSNWSKDDGGVRKSVAQLTSDLFTENDTPEILRDSKRVKRVIDMRNNIAHGNVPIDVEMIEDATKELESLENAAFAVLDRIRTKLTFKE